PPLQTTSAAGTLVLKLVGPEGIVASTFPLKLIVDCAVKPAPVAVSVNPVDAPAAERGFTDERLKAGRLGRSKFQTPRPCVPATKVREALRSFRDKTTTLGRPVATGVHNVPFPAVAFEEAKTPASVARKTVLSVVSVGSITISFTGMSGRFPATAVQEAPELVVISM